MQAKILIVDDDEKVASEIQNSLSGNGYVTIFAKNGKQGFELAKREQPDLIVLEASLPELDGFSV